MDKIKEGRRVFDVEIEALKKMRDCLDESFAKIIDLVVNCKGKVIVTGIGKPGHIAKKIAATFASLGTPSFYLHPGEAMHGDLGMISEDDVVIIISYSGESDEIVRIIPNIKMIGATLVGITGNATSTLTTSSDMVQIIPDINEACYLGLAPTSSTTVALCYGDALAVVASRIYGFKDLDFGKLHPAGSLGKKLILKVDDLMYKDEYNAVININATLKDTIVEISKKGLGMVSVIDEAEDLAGVITDGDLRRLLEKGADVYSILAKDIMTSTPKVVSSGKLAVEALKMMNDLNISAFPVVSGKKIMGTILMKDIIKKGIFI